MSPGGLVGPMGYELIDTADVEALEDRQADCVEISDHFVKPPERVDDAEPRPARGPRRIGLRVYRAEPGQSLGGLDEMHYHEEQEETFYVVDGELAVETPQRTFRVGAGQALVVEPGSPQRAHVPEDAPGAHVVAVGAPSYTDLGRNDSKRYEA